MKKLSKNLLLQVSSIFLLATSCSVFSGELQSNISKGNNGLCLANYQAQKESSAVTLISEDFLFLEGPTWSTQTQAFYFSEMNFNSEQSTGPISTIYQLTLPDHITRFIENSGSNGLLAKGNVLYSMNHGTRSLTPFNLTDKKRAVLVDNFQGQHFNSPNDLTLHSAGHIYFTDPNWQLGDRTQETPFTGVYWLNTNGKVSLIDKTLVKPNGIVLSPDQKTLYVGDFGNKISTYPVHHDGSVGERKTFVTIKSPDGMAVDCAGNLYATSHSEGNIYVYSPQGKQLDKIKVGPSLTNLAFGGADMKTLLITTGKGLFSLKVAIPGVTL